MTTATLPRATSLNGIGSTKLIEITPAMASDWLANYRYPRQRGIKPAVVNQYRDAILSGTFEGAQIIFCICEECDRIYMVNGYHTCSAIVAADVPVLLPEPRLETRRTMADVDAYYARIDRGKARTTTDVFLAHSVAERLDMPPSIATRLSGAAPWIVLGFKSAPLLPDADLRISFMMEWANELALYYHIVEGGSKWATTLMAAPVASVALVTLRYQQDRATEFWRTIVENDGLRKGTPERTLCDFLQSGPIQKLGRRRVAHGTAICWNAYFQHRPLSIIRVFNEGSPVTIAGTPYKGR